MLPSITSSHNGAHFIQIMVYVNEMGPVTVRQHKCCLTVTGNGGHGRFTVQQRDSQVGFNLSSRPAGQEDGGMDRLPPLISET